MEQYGEIIDERFENTIPSAPALDELYKTFVNYFKNPRLTKFKDNDHYTIYMAKINCLLTNISRYIIVIVDHDNNNIGTTCLLSELHWKSFQTRTLDENHDLPYHTYQPHRGSLLDCEIERIKIEEEGSVYKCDKFPITITLLHTKNGAQGYANKGLVISALETFQTIVCIT